jgi:hypothetical protein
MSGGTISNSYFDGDVEGGFIMGGFVGYMSSAPAKIMKSYAVGTVNGTAGLGGFGGWVDSGSTIEDSYAICDTTFTSNSQWMLGGAGGFVGLLDFSSGAATTLNRVYAAGSIIDVSGVLTSHGALVASIGTASGTVLNSFADTNLSSNGLVGANAGGTITASSAQATANMKVSATYTGAGWSFPSVWSRADRINSGFPYLK